MYYAIVNSNTIEKFGTLVDLFPTAGFPPTGPDQEFLDANNMQAALEYIDHNSTTHKLVYCDPYILENKVYCVIAEKFTKAEALENKNALAAFEALQGE
jgi:hypothetical protein